MKSPGRDRRLRAIAENRVDFPKKGFAIEGMEKNASLKTTEKKGAIGKRRMTFQK